MLLARTAEKGFAHGYQRHKPEQTLLYQIIEHHYPEFQALMAAQNRSLPKFVQKEFDEYLRCGRLEYGFLRVKCEKLPEDECSEKLPAERHIAMGWAQRLKRVFKASAPSSRPLPTSM